MRRFAQIASESIFSIVSRTTALLVAFVAVLCTLAPAKAYASDYVYIGGTPATSITVGKTYYFQPWLLATNKAAVTFSIKNKPVWATFNAKTGALGGKIYQASGYVGTYAGITIVASDGVSKNIMPAFTITVSDGASTGGGTGGTTGGSGGTTGGSGGTTGGTGGTTGGTGGTTGGTGGTTGGTGGTTGGTGATTNAPPVIKGTPVGTATVGAVYNFQPTATDANGDKLTFSIAARPAWATFNTATGLLTGTPASNGVGTYAGIVISASDGKATTALPPFSIVVAAAASASKSITLAWTAPTTNLDGSALSNLSGYVINYGTSATNLTKSVQISSAATTSQTITGLSTGAWYFGIVSLTNTGMRSPLSNVASVTIN
jgi:hypothetical protein